MTLVRSIQVKFFVETKDMYRERVYATARCLIIIIINISPCVFISPINTQESFPDLKKGIKLPKSPLQWSTANDFFKLTFSNLPITPRDLNNNINTMATVVYNYSARILDMSTIIMMFNTKENMKAFQLKI